MRLPAACARPAFRSLLVAGLVSETGDWLLLIALPVVVYQLTGSALGTSLALLVELAPGILLGPLAGWCADRWDRRRVLIAVSGLQAVALAPLLVVHSRAELPVVYAVIMAEAALTALFDPVKNALLPTLVPGTEVVSANSLAGLGQNLARLAGGPLGGVLLAVGGLRLVAAADLVSYLIAAAVIGRIAITPAPARPPAFPPGPQPRTGPQPQAGPQDQAVPRRETGPQPPAGPQAGRQRPAPGAYRSVLRRGPLRGALLVTLISQVAQGIFVVLFILFVARRLHGSPGDIGLLRGVQAVGAIAGGAVLVAVARRYSPGTLTAWSAIAFGAVSLVLWNAPLVSTAIPLYVALFIVAGAPGVVLGTGLISAVQTGTDDDSRGRVFGAFGLIGNVGQAAGMLAAGLLAAPLGLLSILDAQGVLYLAAGAIAAWSMTGHRVRRRPRRPALRSRSAPGPGQPRPGQSHAAGTAPRPAAAAGPPASSR